jgi:hypothetical protein
MLPREAFFTPLGEQTLRNSSCWGMSGEPLTAIEALTTGVSSGARGARTPDLLHAMQALFQLSYGPAPWYRAFVARCGQPIGGIAVDE